MGVEVKDCYGMQGVAAHSGEPRDGPLIVVTPADRAFR